MNRARLEIRVKTLAKKHRVPLRYGVVSGAYVASPIREIEILFHDIAHWMTIGQKLEKLPSRLGAYVTDVFDRMSQLSGNSLEIDTAFVTFLAGHHLGFWDDPQAIMESCRKNLRGLLFMKTSELVVEFRKRLNSTSLFNHSIKIAKWFRPSQKLLPFNASVFGTEPSNTV